MCDSNSLYLVEEMSPCPQANTKLSAQRLQVVPRCLDSSSQCWRILPRPTKFLGMRDMYKLSGSPQYFSSTSSYRPLAVPVMLPNAACKDSGPSRPLCRAVRAVTPHATPAPLMITNACYWCIVARNPHRK
jgi:hypothetical protein